MFENVRNIKFFKADNLSNEDYHADEDHVSGSTLSAIFHDCPAGWRYAEQKESAALHFGIASHAATLEPSKFDAEFICDIDKNADDVITSDAAIKAWLKARGVAVKSTASFSDLCKFVVDTGEQCKYLKLDSLVLEAENTKLSDNHPDGDQVTKTIVSYDNFQTIMQMRKVLFADQDMADLLSGAVVEASIYCEVMINGYWVGVKIRPDIITKDFSVPDYKTTADMNPEKFGRQAHDAGYWLKMAFQHDVLQAVKHATKAWKNLDPKMGFIAQGKKAPHIHQLYWMTEQQIEIGREQYQSALMQYIECKRRDVWPAYFNGPVDLPTPDYLARRYGFEDDEIVISVEE